MSVYTHGHHESVLRSHRRRDAENSAGYLLSHLRPETALLDVGCGPGTITIDLAARLPDGRVVGVDSSAEVVELAREAAAGDVRAPSARLEFQVADLYELPFPDDTFDVVHAHQVLQHLPDPVAALVEMRRVCKPGGIVAARDSDYAAMTWYPQMAELYRWLGLYRATARRNGAEPDAGRHLLAWAHAAGFEDVTASASAWCFATAEERAWWGGLWSERIVDSAVAEQIVSYELAKSEELERIGRAWNTWAAEPDAWFAVLHGEILCRA
ncbi:MAG: type 11 methyltransferase [Acidimicrobiaceae bacterium]|jgi:ubiquinone/menaquinone biosynthesis C-methylase UbiE|nr:type 11 methyltransferase [Acidimicrobiaceae bacterium]